MKRYVFLLAMAVALHTFSAAADDLAAKGYDYVSDFAEGTAVAHHSDGKYYVVNEAFEQLSKQGFSHMADFKAGWRLTTVRDGAKSGFIARDGQLHGALDYDMTRVINGNLFEASRGGKTFLMTKMGERIDDAEYEELQYITSLGYFIAKRDGSFITLGDEGNVLFNKGFECVLSLKNGVLVALEKEQWYEISIFGEKKGAYNIRPFVAFNKWELGILQAVRKCIVVDQELTIIDDRFEDVLEFSDRGLFRFRIGSKMGYIDGRGRELVKAEECVALPFQSSVGVTYNADNLRYKVYGLKGREMFDASEIDYMSDFINTCAIARPRGTDYYGIIDIHGKWLCQPTYNKLERNPKSDKEFFATYNNTNIVIDKSGKMLRAQ